MLTWTDSVVPKLSYTRNLRYTVTLNTKITRLPIPINFNDGSCQLILRRRGASLRYMVAIKFAAHTCMHHQSTVLIMSKQPSHVRFCGYPKPRKGPDVPYKAIVPTDPPLIGNLLLVVVWLLVFSLTRYVKTLIDNIRIVHLSWLQKFLWHNAGFGSLRKLKCLSEYNERFDVRDILSLFCKT